MASLAELAVEKLSIKEIWENGVLSAPLPSHILTRLQAKITLQNMYEEKILASDMDLDLFALALDNSASGFLWSYINVITNKHIQHKYNPLSQEGETYIKSLLHITRGDFERVRKTALQNFLNDLLVYISSNLDYPGHIWGYCITHVLSKLENGKWKLLIINLLVKSDEDNNSPIEIYNLDSLDLVLSVIYIGILMYCRNYSRALLVEAKHLPKRLSSSLIKSFIAMKATLDCDTEELWEKLKTRFIILGNNFELSLRILEYEARVCGMGNHLYIVTIDKSGTNFECYSREDALLILSSFFLPDNKSWYFSCILPRQSMKI